MKHMLYMMALLYLLPLTMLKWYTNRGWFNQCPEPTLWNSLDCKIELRGISYYTRHLRPRYPLLKERIRREFRTFNRKTSWNKRGN